MGEGPSDSGIVLIEAETAFGASEVLANRAKHSDVPAPTAASPMALPGVVARGRRAQPRANFFWPRWGKVLGSDGPYTTPLLLYAAFLRGGIGVDGFTTLMIARSSALAWGLEHFTIFYSRTKFGTLRVMRPDHPDVSGYGIS
jgi:hypothetical protein